MEDIGLMVYCYRITDVDLMILHFLRDRECSPTDSIFLWGRGYRHIDIMFVKG
jgi:hypothetical protein